MKTKYIKLKEKQIPVKVHNQREENLVNIINLKNQRVVEWYKEETFDKRTYTICTREVNETNTLMSALYFLDCIADDDIYHYSLGDLV